MLDKIKKAISLIGPYPYNPILIFSFFSACYFSRFIPVIIEQPKGFPRYQTAFLMLLLATIPSYFFSIFAFFIQKYRKWSDKNIFYYILEIALVQSFLFLIAPMIRNLLKKRYNFEFEAPLRISVGFYLGTLVIIIISLGLLHRAELSVLNRLKEADQLTEQLEKDRRSLIYSDEKLRKQTSQFLHDRVQSDLMVIGMRLKAIQGKSDEDFDNIISDSISRLENIRTSDLRNLVQILTPNFEGGGFSEALRNLGAQYQLDFDSTFQISSNTDLLSENQQLGIFRIIEQSLLNSLVHAKSNQVRVLLEVDANGLVQLSVSDEGDGVDLTEIKPGVGTSVIDSWVAILNAQKEIVSTPEMGYSISVRFNR